MSEIKEIPKHWKWVKMEDIAKWGSGGTPTSTDPQYYGGSIPWLIIGDLNDGYITQSEKKITKAGLENSSAKMVQPESVLIAMYGSIGKLGINKIHVATNQAIAFTEKLNNNIANKYLFYYLFHIRGKLHSLGKGGTQKNISQTVLKKVDLPLPPLPEQQAIVAKIEALLSELENGKQQLQTAQQQLKMYRQSLLKWAFEGKLTNKNVKEGELPKGWKWVTADDVTSKITDGEHLTPKRIPEGEMLLSAKNVRDGYIDYSNFDCISKLDFEKCLLRCNPEVGDILIVSVGATIGRASIVKEKRKFALVRSVALLKPQSIISNYLLYYIQSPQTQKRIQELSQGSAQNCLYINKIKQIEIPLPPLNEQQQIVEELESKLTICDKIEETISLSLQQAETLKQSILKKAFEGKLI
jgi:type I restriction enzyme S subunit